MSRDLREEVAYAVRRKASLYISTLEGEQIADAILPIIAREVEAALDAIIAREVEAARAALAAQAKETPNE
jgi:hypothetical protein